MLYVQRDQEGHIVAINSHATAECYEALDANHDDIKAILEGNKSSKPGEHTSQLRESDLDFIRVVEDLINLLISKNVICFTDLPEEAQRKINHRRNIRAALNRELDLLDDEDFLI
ncbi:hypothetical protein [Aurantivibrio plasticivorans]